MAGGALPVVEVISLFCNVAGRAEASRRSKAVDCGWSMTRGALRVRGLERLVSTRRIHTAVTCAAILSDGVMLLVSIAAHRFRRCWSERDRSSVTLEARALRVRGMPEFHRAGLRRVSFDRYRRGRDAGSSGFRRLVARGTRRARRCLMMTDRTAARG